jgi:hypothetical protein
MKFGDANSPPKIPEHNDIADWSSIVWLGGVRQNAHIGGKIATKVAPTT